MSKTKNTKQIEINSSDDDIELVKGEPILAQKAEPKLRKNGQPKKEYILTDARKNQFEVARNKRQENIALKKEEKEKANSEYSLLKKELDKKLAKKEKRSQAKELLKLMNETKNISSDEDSDEEVIIKKKSKKPKKKVVYVEDDSESEEEEEHRPKTRREPLRSQTPTRELRPIIRYY